MTVNKKNKSESASQWKLLKEASGEVESWPNWLQKNAGLLFEEEQEEQRKIIESYGQNQRHKALDEAVWVALEVGTVREAVKRIRRLKERP